MPGINATKKSIEKLNKHVDESELKRLENDPYFKDDEKE